MNLTGRKSEVFFCLVGDLTQFVHFGMGALARHEGNGHIFVSGPSQGLKSLFESKSVVKVMHDCHAASDVLCHVYHAQLETVFDSGCVGDSQ